ncbi:MAG: hypothetical protein AAFN77_23210 [Planctomycetota bacterium]
MSQTRVLLTGDYWHEDFRTILQEMSVAVTLQPIETLIAPETSEADVERPSVDLVLIAVSRPDQFPPETIEKLCQAFAPTSVICLLGSWCEGELRSGSPPPGIPRVYWHQWGGRFQRFQNALANQGDCTWTLPRTANDADRILQETETLRDEIKNASAKSDRVLIAVSALTAQSFEMVADAANCFDYLSEWIEYLSWEARRPENPSLICIDADSWSPECEKRVKALRDDYAGVPILLLLNYPRSEELAEARHYGIEQIVSKPFRLGDLKIAIESSLGAGQLGEVDSRKS